MKDNIHEQLADYLIKAVESFKNDPATTDFQKGYLAALIEIADQFSIVVNEP